jgi:uncharacterized protein YlzI (FlbEa/FlbD family)
MGRVIRVDTVKGGKLEINPQHIQLVTPSLGKSSHGTVIQLVSGKKVKVKQTADEIKTLRWLSTQPMGI